MAVDLQTCQGLPSLGHHGGLAEDALRWCGVDDWQGRLVQRFRHVKGRGNRGDVEHGRP